MKIAIKAIRTDGGTQVRAQLSQSQVEEYASQMREGDEFPRSMCSMMALSIG
jgi:hypothetical protein